ncbi:GH1 family beta-glucosidase [Rudaeicoccus suwonensis]|uniref:Beta-glucosidase n=1 Tax=Rudaeicoccus suwonensis TaxID=657409 RepID=A0A561DX15_9MICO|nr:GH1 family beta-glucosidase [Rudaeicoccus suwonensis]TWE07915.1 broad-specificity cellobiase [Rudaeicoccus suwonensis]
MSVQFPADFVFGAATASYQIEGAVDEDGRGTSIWDTFSHTPGAVVGGDTGDVACDHYHRYPEDIELMRRLGLDSYRFSIAWPRIQPDGAGEANKAGLDFYDRLVDSLLDNGIDPCATIYHWDLPQALEDAGGWRNRDTAHRFADYAALVHDHLGDRVHRWITLNEPFCSSILGYAEGRHAPGAKEGDGALAAAHHLLLGHGFALAALRATDIKNQIGITLNLQPVQPVSDDPADVAAADRSLLLSNLLFTDPVLAGRYPQLARQTWGELSDFGWIRDGDLATIGAPLDFLGVNYYFPSNVKAVPNDEPDASRRTADDIGAKLVIPDGEPLTEMGWPIDADGLNRLMHWLKDTYPGLPPIYITENGRASVDEVRSDGSIDDQDRIEYLRTHLTALAAARGEGVDVRGYYLWSLLDNFEWAEGYAKRFGAVHVDYGTQKRTPKASFEWYRNLVATRQLD